MHNKLKIVCVTLLVTLFGCNNSASDNNLSDEILSHVDTRIGTKPWDGQSTLSKAELPIGNVYPGVGEPFAMTQWSPQNSTGDVAYRWNEPNISGFRGSHYPNGASMSEYAAITLMPVVGAIDSDATKRTSSYSHESEVATPYYYSVELEDSKVKAELTGLSKSGFMRFSYPKSDEASIVINSAAFFNKEGGYYRVIPESNKIEGYITTRGRVGNQGHTPEGFACYFVAEFNKPFKGYGLLSKSNDLSVKEIEKMALKGVEAEAAYLTFSTTVGEMIEAKIGTSFISMKQARENLANEMGGSDFDAVVAKAKAAWAEPLSKIVIEGTDAQKDIFYTAMQRCMVLPRDITEDGYHYSAYNGRVMPGIMYTDFSLWDTFRSLHPLLLLLEPERVNDMITALLNSYDEGGWIPKWPSPGYSNIMIATHGDAVIADAYVKGVRGYDQDKALEAMLKNANVPGNNGYVARGGILDYLKYGYVPTDKHGESAIRTLEFSYDDFCIAQMSKAMGKEELYEEYMKRSGNYINTLDPETKMVRGRNTDGKWRAATDASISGWAQGTDEDRDNYFRNITLFVPHDVKGLAEFMGGDSELVKYLDYFFDNDYYYVGDEFSMHSPYMYNYVGAPWKTQKTIRRLIKDYFTNDAGGLPGNEDCGQLSSWYVFGAIGFYPACPGVAEYQIGSPSYNKVSINLPNGKLFTVVANNNSDENIYIQSATFNGKPYNKCFISHKDITSGGTLEFEMGSEPNMSWGIDIK